MTTKNWTDDKGNEHILLELVPEGKGKPFSIGIGKAKTILDSIKSIKDFVAKHEPAAKLPKGITPEIMAMAQALVKASKS